MSYVVSAASGYRVGFSLVWGCFKWFFLVGFCCLGGGASISWTFLFGGHVMLLRKFVDFGLNER